MVCDIVHTILARKVKSSDLRQGTLLIRLAREESTAASRLASRSPRAGQRLAIPPAGGIWIRRFSSPTHTTQVVHSSSIKQRRNKTLAGPGGLEPPLFPLTAECFAIKLQANKTKSPAVAGVLVAFDLLNLIDYAKKASDCWLCIIIGDVRETTECHSGLSIEHLVDKVKKTTVLRQD